MTYDRFSGCLFVVRLPKKNVSFLKSSHRYCDYEYSKTLLFLGINIIEEDNMKKWMHAFKRSSDHHHMFLYVLLLFLLCALQNSSTYAKPYDMWSSYQSLIPKSETDCDINDGIETLCQRCAKQTKSNVVYPMCCQNREEAREWCQKYISFGLQ